MTFSSTDRWRGRTTYFLPELFLLVSLCGIIFGAGSSWFRTFQANRQWYRVVSLDFLPDGRTFVMAIRGSEGRSAIRLVDVTGVRQTEELFCQASYIWDVRVSPDGEMVAWGDHEGSVWVRRFGSGGSVRIVLENKVTAVSFSQNSEYLAVASGKRLRIWRVADWKELGALHCKNQITAVVWVYGGRAVAIGMSSGNIAVYDISSKERRVAFSAHRGEVNALAVAPDGIVLASAGYEDVKLFELGTGREVAVLESSVAKWGESTSYSVTFSSDGALLASGAFGEAHVWEIAKNGVLTRIPCDEGGAFPVAVRFAARNCTLAIGGAKGIKLWDRTGGVRAMVLEERYRVIPFVVASCGWLLLWGAQRRLMRRSKPVREGNVGERACGEACA